MNKRAIHLTVLGGGQSIGKSCFLVSVGDQHVLLDCGSFVGKDTKKALPDFSKLPTGVKVNDIAAVLISHFHMDHVGGLFYLTEPEVPADGNIITLHDTIDTIEHELRRKLNCNAVIHMDPVSTSDPETLSLKAEVSGYLDQIDPKLSMHDFRIVKGPTHTNVIFDIVIPYDYPVSDQEVMDSITKRIQTSHPDFFTVIEVDKAVVQ